MTRLLLILLTFALLIGLSPTSNHMFAMQTMQIDEMTMSQHRDMADDSAGENSTMPCCDEIAQFSISCAFLVPQFAYVVISGGSERVGYSAPLIQSIYIEILAPPPKA